MICAAIAAILIAVGALFCESGKTALVSFLIALGFISARFLA